MRLLKPIKDFFEFIYKDTKTDLLFLKKLGEGKTELKFNKEELKELLDVKGFLKENWLFFLIVILAFSVGYNVAAAYYENTCNELIYQEYIKPNLPKARLGIEPLPFNMSEAIGEINIPNDILPK